MSGPGPTGSNYGSQMQNQQNWDKPRHGASVEISEWGSGAVRHLDNQGVVSTPLIRSYKDGIRVGCTFITTEALKKIHSLHSRFLQKEDGVTHQEARP